MKEIIILSIKNIKKITDSIRLEKELNKLKSVKSNVNIISHRALIRYKEKVTPLEKILDVILDCGFFASVWDEKSEYENHSHIRKKQSKSEISPYCQESIAQKKWMAVDLVGSVKVNGKMILYAAFSALNKTRCEYAGGIEKLAIKNGCFAGIYLFREVQEKGVKCYMEGRIILVGDLVFMRSNGIASKLLPIVNLGYSPLYVVVDGILAGFFIMHCCSNLNLPGH